ncbi:MAG: RlmE family RNA methyltransferase [Deltaproteobacteria bacterium]|nr:MAG: RlmE family RNA methyltransferase [Deltaproteobacteria bacterium]
MSRRFDPRDAYFKRAKAEGYRARSAFKLQEILERHRIVRRGDTVLDLGAAPGGFLQVLAEAVGPRGKVVGVDLKPIAPLGLPQVKTLVADVESEELDAVLRSVHPGRFAAVVSDMAPATSGVGDTDVARSLRLVERALALCGDHLRGGGGFVAKAFMGRGFDALIDASKRSFRRLKIVRPRATRSRSRECFLVGEGYRPARRP